MAPENDITPLLQRLATGDAKAESELYSTVYDELRDLAGWFLRRERPGHTLQPTALVHEAYLRLIGKANAGWNGRAHFFNVAASVMRCILVDHARNHCAQKRGGGVQAVELRPDVAVSSEQCDFLLSLDEALTRLAAFDKRQAKIVEMRFFAGMTDEEVGLILGLSSRTVKRDWSMAKAWLQAELWGGGAAARH